MKRNYPHRWVWWRTTRGFSSVVVVVVVVRCNVSLVLIVANGHDDDKTTFVVRLDTVYVEIQTQIPVLLPRQLQSSGAGPSWCVRMLFFELTESELEFV